MTPFCAVMVCTLIGGDGLAAGAALPCEHAFTLSAKNRVVQRRLADIRNRYCNLRANNVSCHSALSEPRAIFGTRIADAGNACEPLDA